MSSRLSRLIPLGAAEWPTSHKSEIINQYLIGTGLDAFREAFSSTCEDLDYDKSLDVTQYFDKDSQAAERRPTRGCVGNMRVV
jgi:hypothetical protein